MWYYELGYVGLFLACLISATIIPFTSEGILILFLLSGYNPTLSLIVATGGNTLGSILNYLLGMLGNPESINKFFKKEKRKEKFIRWIKQFGPLTGLLAWVPIIGDPLTVAMGFFRIHFLQTLFFILIGKCTRYYIIIFLMDY